MKRRWWAWISAAIVVVGVLVAISVVWSSLLGNVPVRPSIANGALVLTSRSASAWTARVTVAGGTSAVEVGPHQVVQVPIPSGGRSFEIALLRPGESQPGWTIEYEPPHASLATGGVDAGAGYSVTATLTELLHGSGN